MMERIMLTDKQTELLRIIENSGGEWLTRRQIAELIDPERKQLNVREDEALETLALNGLIETEQRPIKSAIPFQFFYRAKSE